MEDSPASPACTTTVMPDSLTRAQNGSNTSSAGESGPPTVIGAAARMTTAAGILVERPLQLAHGLVDVGQRDVGGGEDAVLVRHAPVLGQPAVEGTEEEDDGARVVLERLLVEHAERGEEPDLGQALRVHGGEAGVAVAVLGPDRLGLAHQLVHGPAVGVAPEVVDQRAGAA